MMKAKKHTSPLPPLAEERAFVYQQALELSPLLSQGNSKEPIAVILKKHMGSKARFKYSVTFVLIPNSLNLQVHCEGNNLFDVCINAKNKAKKTISHLINHASHPVRSLKLKHFKKFPYMH